MKDARTVCHEHGIWEKRAIQVAEIIQQIVVEDIQAMLLNDSIRPLHERLMDYINIQTSEEKDKAPKDKREKKSYPRGC